jgi:hypothetical protein
MGMVFQRRELALVNIADMRSFAHHLYIAHCLWDWPDKGGRAAVTEIDLREHCDAVMAQLIGIGDELSRFLTLPTTSRSRHRMTPQGRREAARTVEVAYHLLESMVTHRVTRLSMYAERIKKVGMPSGEISRMRQFERFIEDCIEKLRMTKMYRTPQALRSFARIFTFLLPPFYAPSYAQVAIEVHSLGMGVAFGIITALGLTALFESLQVLEDPFVAYLALDGIDVREEFEVLLWSSLNNTRRLVFPDAPPFPMGRRTALTTQHANRANVLNLHLPENTSMKGSSKFDSKSSRKVSADANTEEEKEKLATTTERVEEEEAAEATEEKEAEKDKKGAGDDEHGAQEEDGDDHSLPSTIASIAAPLGGHMEIENIEDQEILEEAAAAEFGDALQEEDNPENIRESNFTEEGQAHHHRRMTTAGSGFQFVGLWNNA